MSDEIPEELTLQMGRQVQCSILQQLYLTPSVSRPVSQTLGEVRGFLDRARYMISIAESCLGDLSLKDTDKPGFRRYIKRTPLGVVLVIAPWKWVSVHGIFTPVLIVCS